MSFLGSIIGGIGSLAGGLFGKSSQDKANAANIQLQKDFAQKGIQWKVADARKAGVHPLAALGASTVGFSPSVVGSSALGDAVSNMGQDIGRAVDAAATRPTRLEHLQTAIAEQQLRGLQLDNDGKFIANTALASSAARTAMSGPPMPTATGNGSGMPGGMPGQGDFTSVRVGNLKTVPAPVSDAQTLSDRYGEVVEWLGGLGVLGADMWKNRAAIHQSLNSVDWAPFKVERKRPRNGGGGW